MRFFVRLKCLVLSFILLSLTACAMNSVNSLNLREGIHSFKRQNYRSAFIRLMPEAEKGNVDAQYAVGYMYYYGEEWKAILGGGDFDIVEEVDSEPTQVFTQEPD